MSRPAVGLRFTLVLSILLITLSSVALAAPSAVSVTPNQGSGLSQRFTFVFSDSSGWTNLKQVNANIGSTGGNANSCLVSYMPGNRYIYLLDDAGTAYLPGAPVGTNLTLQNSQCSINVEQSGSQGSGNDLTLYVAIDFNAAYSGGKSIYMGAVNNSGANSGWRILGTWTVASSAGGGSGTCNAGPAPSVNICSPTSGSTVPSPVHLVATPSSNNGVVAMAVYVDNILAYKQNVQSIDTDIDMSAGTHYIVVQFWDNSGNVPAKAAVSITVGATSSQPTATLSASPGTISSGGSSTLTWSTTNASSVSIDNGIGTVPSSGSVSVTPGGTTTYTLTATGPGGTATATATVTVASGGGGGGTCSPATGAPSITICTPTNGSTVPSPVHIMAAPNSNNGVIAIAVYVDNSLAYKQNVQTLDTNINMSNGSHYVVVQYWDNSGNVPAKAAVNITVGGTSGQPTATFSANPITISSGGSSTLTWSTTNASSVSIDQGIGSVPASGSMTVSPTTTTTYTLTATGNGATTSATATVTVGSGSGGGSCNPPSSPGAVICTPAPGSSVTSPVQFTGAGTAANGSVNHLELWIDGNKIGNYFSSTMSTSVSLAAGSHSATLVEVDSSGSYIKSSPDTFTVTSGGGGGGGAPGSVDVLTAHNDPARTGANTQETTLTPANVNPNQFGKIVGYGVDGQIYAQPLIVSNLGIGGGTHNVLYVATEHNSVYAFDADHATGTPYWSETLLAPGQSPVSSSDGLGITPEIGITSTPVIDRRNNVLYVLAYVNNGGQDQFWLHALDLASGAERFGGPARVTATVSGNGGDSSNGQIALEGGCWQRAGLALANGNVYIGFGHCQHGWMLAYNATTLQQAGVYNTSPNGSGGTIWMGGGAPAIDSGGNVYVMAGTNFGDTPNSGFNNSFLKFSPSLGLLGYFQPSNNATLVQNDADLGSGGPMILPDNSSQFPHELVGAGKDGRIFVLNRDNMGGFDPSANHAVQIVQSGSSQYNNFYDTPAFWNGKLYYHANGDVLRVFSWQNGLLSTSPVMTGATMFSVHGDTPSISSNGGSAGIVWELQHDGQPSQPVVLHAYDANDVSRELYNSSMNSGDAAGPAVKFTVPTIANGKVYVPAGNQVDIYGPK